MLKITNMSKSFNIGTENQVNLFEGFNLEIEENKCTAIIGPNGCGKSTLLNMISGSIDVDSGEITLGKENLTVLKEEQRSNHIGRV